jgi:hypothetical protein
MVTVEIRIVVPRPLVWVLHSTSSGRCPPIAIYEYTPFCNGPDDVKPPSERHAAEPMLLSVVNAWPPHHAVRGSGEPI